MYIDLDLKDMKLTELVQVSLKPNKIILTMMMMIIIIIKTRNGH